MISPNHKNKQEPIGPSTAQSIRPDLLFVRYVLLGFIGLIVDYSGFWVLVETGVSPVISTVISSLLGILTNYFLNARLNFKKDTGLDGAAKFIGVGSLGLALSALIIAVLTGAGLTPLLAKAVSIPPIVLLQFTLNRRWTFK